MKILQLNAWTGRLKGALTNFFRENDFDVICLQEAVWSEKEDILENFFTTVNQIKEASGLKFESKSPNFRVRFGAESKTMLQGNVILSREKILEEKIETVFGKDKIVDNIEELNNHAYTVQMVKLSSGINVVNHHGYWQPNPIGNETTIKVMKKVAGLVKGLSGPIVMCGDLNIVYESPAMRELDFLTDLTDKYKVNNTLMGIKFKDKVACDHILINDDITVNSFKVLDDLISDHRGVVAEIKY